MYKRAQLTNFSSQAHTHDLYTLVILRSAPLPYYTHPTVSQHFLSDPLSIPCLRGVTVINYFVYGKLIFRMDFAFSTL